MLTDYLFFTCSPTRNTKRQKLKIYKKNLEADNIMIDN